MISLKGRHVLMCPRKKYIIRVTALKNWRLPTQLIIFLDFWAEILRIAHPVNYSWNINLPEVHGSNWCVLAKPTCNPEWSLSTEWIEGLTCKMNTTCIHFYMLQVYADANITKKWGGYLVRNAILHLKIGGLFYSVTKLFLNNLKRSSWGSFTRFPNFLNKFKYLITIFENIGC